VFLFMISVIPPLPPNRFTSPSSKTSSWCIVKRSWKTVAAMYLLVLDHFGEENYETSVHLYEFCTPIFPPAKKKGGGGKRKKKTIVISSSVMFPSNLIYIWT
jgi:hypothetical protein